MNHIKPDVSVCVGMAASGGYGFWLPAPREETYIAQCGFAAPALRRVEGRPQILPPTINTFEIKEKLIQIMSKAPVNL